MFPIFNKIARISPVGRIKQFTTSTLTRASEHETMEEPTEKVKSDRIRQFHEKLKLQPVPRVGPRERFVDLVLVETDPNSGELITNSEKDPTKWGDWQIGGRVSDF